MGWAPDDLARLCVRFDVDGADGVWFQRPMAKGQRTKHELRPVGANPPVAGHQWFWKSSVARFPLEFWSEVIAFHVGTAAGFEVPVCFPSRCEGQWGVITRSFLPSERHALLHGGDLLQAIDPEYDRQSRGERQSVQFIYQSLDHVGLADLRKNLFTTLLFDAWTGNQDRHHENWGLVLGWEVGEEHPRVHSLAPAFDNGASLLRELRDDGELRAKVGCPESLSGYAARAMCEPRWESGGQYERLPHFEFVRRHIDTFEWSRAIIKSFVDVPFEGIVAALIRVRDLSRACTGAEISEYRLDRIRAVLDHRRRRIMELL